MLGRLLNRICEKKKMKTTRLEYHVRSFEELFLLFVVTGSQLFPVEENVAKWCPVYVLEV
jgi:hypothetical protein